MPYLPWGEIKGNIYIALGFPFARLILGNSGRLDIFRLQRVGKELALQLVQGAFQLILGGEGRQV